MKHFSISILLLILIIFIGFFTKNKQDQVILNKPIVKNITVPESNNLQISLAESSTAKDQTNFEDPLEQYKNFLNGKTTVKSHDGDLYTIKHLLEADINDEVDYAFFDMNGDSIPELHLSGRFYYVLTQRQGELMIWHDALPYSGPLNNGAMLYKRPGGAPTHIDYQYIILDFNGNVTRSIAFSQYDSDEPKHEKTWYIEGIKVSKKDWDLKVKGYLSIKSNLIKWQKIKIKDTKV